MRAKSQTALSESSEETCQCKGGALSGTGISPIESRSFLFGGGNLVGPMGF
jgi:hypothetical protein